MKSLSILKKISRDILNPLYNENIIYDNIKNLNDNNFILAVYYWLKIGERVDFVDKKFLVRNPPYPIFQDTSVYEPNVFQFIHYFKSHYFLKALYSKNIEIEKLDVDIADEKLKLCFYSIFKDFFNGYANGLKPFFIDKDSQKFNNFKNRFGIKLGEYIDSIIDEYNVNVAYIHDKSIPDVIKYSEYVRRHKLN